jgi:hypothetical protein
MKKLLLLVLACTSLGLTAKPLQEKIKRLQKATALYAQNEVRSWKCLRELNERIKKLSHRMFKKCSSSRYF